MIYITVNKPSKIDISLLDKAVHFASEFLKLDIEFTIEFESLKRHQYGFCDYDEDDIVIVIAKRLSPENVVRTLFHELVHVQQYETGRLKHNGIWEGKEYNCSYDDNPWEREAYEIEEKMMRAFYGCN